MAFKFVIFAAFVAVAQAGIIAQPGYAAYSAPAYGHAAYAAPAYGHAAYAAPAYGHAAYAAPAVAHYAAAPAYAKVAVPAVAKVAVAEEYDPHPQYSFSYDVQDALTGDSKNQHESRDGDVVHGSYSLTDADGLRRTVEYTADPHNGFNAVVHREPLHVKAIAAAPVIAKVAAPVHYAAAPAYSHGYAAPAYAHGYAAPAIAKVAYAAPAYGYHH